MKQVSKEGRLMDSATPSPKESPLHAQQPVVDVSLGQQEALRRLPEVVQGSEYYQNKKLFSDVLRNL